LKLLFDQNLPPRLAKTFAENFPGSEHVRNLGLASADDLDIWTYAKTNGFVIVSKDSDFHQRSFVEGAPPKIVWLRMGNCSTADVERVPLDFEAAIISFERDSAASFLIVDPDADIT
jgi:predicted nuclease of predicted toxin-antitoxin system